MPIHVSLIHFQSLGLCIRWGGFNYFIVGLSNGAEGEVGCCEWAQQVRISKANSSDLFAEGGNVYVNSSSQATVDDTDTLVGVAVFNSSASDTSVVCTFYPQGGSGGGSNLVVQGADGLTAVTTGNSVTLSIADDGITADKLPAGVIGSTELASNSVTTDKIVDGAVTAGKIADGVISDGSLADGSVSTAKLADGAVTEPKLASNSVSGVKIQNLSVTSGKLANFSVTSSKLPNFGITGQKLAAGAVSNDKLGSAAVTGDKVASRTLDYTTRVEPAGYDFSQYVLEFGATNVSSLSASNQIVAVNGAVTSLSLGVTFSDSLFFSSATDGGKGLLAFYRPPSQSNAGEVEGFFRIESRTSTPIGSDPANPDYVQIVFTGQSIGARAGSLVLDTGAVGDNNIAAQAIVCRLHFVASVQVSARADWSETKSHSPSLIENKPSDTAFQSDFSSTDTSSKSYVKGGTAVSDGEVVSRDGAGWSGLSISGGLEASGGALQVADNGITTSKIEDMSVNYMKRAEPGTFDEDLTNASSILTNVTSISALDQIVAVNGNATQVTISVSSDFSQSFSSQIAEGRGLLAFSRPTNQSNAGELVGTFRIDSHTVTPVGNPLSPDYVLVVVTGQSFGITTGDFTLATGTVGNEFVAAQSIVCAIHSTLNAPRFARADWNETKSEDPAIIRNKPADGAFQSDFSITDSSALGYIKQGGVISDGAMVSRSGAGWSGVSVGSGLSSSGGTLSVANLDGDRITAGSIHVNKLAMGVQVNYVHIYNTNLNLGVQNSDAFTLSLSGATARAVNHPALNLSGNEFELSKLYFWRVQCYCRFLASNTAPFGNFLVQSDDGVSFSFYVNRSGQNYNSYGDLVVAGEREDDGGESGTFTVRARLSGMSGVTIQGFNLVFKGYYAG